MKTLMFFFILLLACFSLNSQTDSLNNIQERTLHDSTYLVQPIGYIDVKPVGSFIESNPIPDYVILEMDDNVFKTKRKIRIFDNTGQTLREINIETTVDVFELDISNFSDGTYYYEIFDIKGEVLGVEKFVVNKIITRPLHP